MERKHKNPNCDEYVRSNSWSNLPSDLLISVLECLGFTDFQRAKSVCSFECSGDVCLQVPLCFGLTIQPKTILFYGDLQDVAWFISDIVYNNHKLYISSCRNIFRIIDFSGEIPQENFQCSLHVHRLDKHHRFYDTKIVVTVSGHVLKVSKKVWRSGFRIFKIYDSSSGLLKKSEKVDSLGNEVIVLDLGITVLASQLEEFNTNAIYFNGNYIKNPNTMFLFKLDTKKFERLDKFECSPVQFSIAQCFLPKFQANIID